MPSRQRSNPLLGGMDCPSPHIHRHRGSHSSSISEQRSTAVYKLALKYSLAECPGHSMHLAWLQALHMHSVHACCAANIMLPLHRASSAAMQRTHHMHRVCQVALSGEEGFTVHTCEECSVSMISHVFAQTLRLLAATALVGMVLLAFAGQLLVYPD